MFDIADAEPQADEVCTMFDTPDPRPQADELYAALERREILEAVIDALPPRHAQLIRLRYQHGLTLKEIGQQFGVGESAVSSMHTRVIGIMRRVFYRAGIEARHI